MKLMSELKPNDGFRDTLTGHVWRILAIRVAGASEHTELDMRHPITGNTHVWYVFELMDDVRRGKLAEVV